MSWGQVTGSVGVALLLLAFALNVTGKLGTRAPAYLALNFIGGALACAASVLISFFPFVILEAIWTLVAGVSLVRAMRAPAARRGPPAGGERD